MKILFCSDGTVQAEKAVQFGAPIAAACRAETSILAIARKAEGEEKLLKALRHSQKIFQEHHLDPGLITRVGKPVVEIINQTRETHYDLVVIGAVRKNPLGRLLDPLWKSVLAHSVRADKIIKSVEPPVLLVIGHRPGLGRILLCTNGAAHLDQAVEFTGRIAQAVKASVDLFHVMPQPPAVYDELIRLEEATARLLESKSELGRTLCHQKDLLEQFGVFGKMRLHQGIVVPELQKELRRSEYDLVVCGSSPAATKLTKFMMGDVTGEIVNSAELPLLVMPTGQRTMWGLFKEFLARPLRRFQKTSEA